ncbi:hypothetical protein SNE35_28775 [Paucibacter sp. R3-3]|uniref:Uncharacterized protein n=1 Tax=Roseateles agri TaxID=3098619 RepID=A0ABU5DT19_9BURK|nr:hypothetical protein [Paucibacter sp. R3-3]MDY0748529.1 hypothetical protein [Paucibacter sp. R3-3]
MNAAQLNMLDAAPRAMRAPLAWLQHAELPQAFRACYRCTHGADHGIERYCRHPELLDRGASQPVAIVRAWGGGCGPDAQHLTDPALA